MAATITVACPECRKQIKAAADLLGKKVRCKACGHSFTVSASSAKAPAGKDAKKPGKPGTAKKPAEEDEDANPYGVRTLDLTPRCPNCANEMEDETAIICLHCGYNTQTRIQAATRKLHYHSGMDYFLWLLPGIACVLTIIFLIVFDVMYSLNAEDWTKGEWYEFMSHKGIIMWICIMSVYAMWLSAKFAFNRLILHPHPPEVEIR